VLKALKVELTGVVVELTTSKVVGVVVPIPTFPSFKKDMVSD
jgi:hypothetical protein